MQELFESIKTSVIQLRTRVLHTLFGPHNERIDFVFDTFYKLSPEQQKSAIAVALGFVGGLVSLVVWSYFSGVASLEARLSDAMFSINNLKINIAENRAVEKLYKNTEKDVVAVSNLRHNPYYEALAKKLNVDIKINSKPNTKPQKIIVEQVEKSKRGKINIRQEEADDPLFEKVQFLDTEFRVRKVSLPKLTKMLIEIDKDGTREGANVTKKYLRISKIAIEKSTSDRLFFDAKFTVRAYGRKQ